MRIVPAAGVAALLLVFTLPVLATTQTGPFIVTVTTSPNPYAIEGVTSVNTSAAILGESSGTGDSALEGYAGGQDSAGLEGFASSTSGTASNGVYGYAANGYGVYGQAESAAAAGVLGLNLASSGGMGVIGKAASIGVYGTTTTSGTYGVFGYDATTSGRGHGVGGQSTGGDGVIGFATTGNGVAGTATTGTGVYGFGTSTNGVAGYTNDTVNSSSTGDSSGVLGTDYTNSSTVTGNAGVTGTSTNGYGMIASSTNGIGMYASSTGTYAVRGETVGGQSAVLGVLDNPSVQLDRAGVWGLDSTPENDLHFDFGVMGTSTYGEGVYGGSYAEEGVYGSSDNAEGVYGYATADSAAGVAGVSENGIGLTGESQSTSSPAVAIYAYAGGDIIDAIGAPGGGSAENVMSVDASGNMILAGGLTQHGTPKATVRDASGAERVAYSPRDTQATTEDFGRTQMVGGRAEVRLDPVFASTLADGDYLVFLTARGRSTGLYVANQSLAGFEIRENDGTSTLAIDYRIVGRPRAEHAEPRLALIASPNASLATRRLIRTGAEIARVATAHRAADAKVRALMAHDRLLRHARPVALLKRLTNPKPPAPPHILSVRPGEYGPRLPR